MTGRGVDLLWQRVVALGLAIGCVASFGGMPWWGSALIGGLAVLAYAYWPVAGLRQGALRYARGPAVIGPDWIGIVIVALFAGMPFVAGRSEGTLLHPSLVLTWPMAALFLALPVIGWRRGAFALWITDQGLEAETGLARQSIRFEQITEVRPWRRDLVKYLRLLARPLVAIGQPGAAGALLISRESTGISLALTDGAVFTIPGDGFEPGLKQVLAACAAAGVRIDPRAARLGKLKI